MVALEGTTDNRRTLYAIAGWLAIAQAVLVLPQIVLSVLVELLSRSYPIAKIFLMMMKITGLAVGIYVTFMFKQLLNQQYNFHKTDILIFIQIGGSIIFFFLGLIGLVPSFETAIAIVTVVLMVPFSVIQILFAVYLLKLEDDLFGLKKPYAYTMLGAGICGVTVILMPFSLLAGLVSLVMLGMIFLRAKEEVEFL